MHVLTIGSETFISDLRIRPIKQAFASVALSSQNGANQNKNNNNSNSGIAATSGFAATSGSVEYTWNLEIRRLRRDDSALYYCVLNSDSLYGQIYKLNVLRKPAFLVVSSNRKR